MRKFHGADPENSFSFALCNQALYLSDMDKQLYLGIFRQHKHMIQTDAGKM